MSSAEPAMAEQAPVDADVEASRLVRVVAAVVLVVLSVTFLLGVFDIRSPDGLDPAGPQCRTCRVSSPGSAEPSRPGTG
jgi:putative tricarboxylic transport membrane protein